jgi:hypothetical protein
MSLLEHIVKSGSGYKLLSKKTGKNLGTAKSKAGIEKRERQVQFFKHQHEEVNEKKLPGLMKILTPAQKAVNKRVDAIIAGKNPDQKKESVAEMAPTNELISFAQYFEMVQFDGDPRMFKDPLTRNPLDRGPVTGGQSESVVIEYYSGNPYQDKPEKVAAGRADAYLKHKGYKLDKIDKGEHQYVHTQTGTKAKFNPTVKEADTAGNGDAGVIGGLTTPFTSDLPANISQSPGGYSKDINTPGIPMTMGESPIKKFVRGKWITPRLMKDKYARPKPRFK